MKESFERIVAWSKEHPYLAGLILVGVIVLAWYASRNAGNGGGGFSAAEVSDDSLPPGDFAGGGFGGGGAGEIQPAPVSEPSQASEDISIPSSNGADLYESFEMPYMPPIEPGIPVGSFAGGASIVSTNADALNKSPTKKEWAAPEKKTELSGSSKVGALAKGFTSARATKPSAPVRTKIGADRVQTQTPAQRVGKPRLFTGYHLGIMYVAGYPLFTQTGTTKSVTKTTGTRSRK